MFHLSDQQPRLDSPKEIENPVLKVSDIKWNALKEVVHRVKNADLWTRPWLGWAFVYAFVLVVCLFNRRISLTALITMYASAKDVTSSVVLGALSLGFLEDFVFHKNRGTARFLCNFSTFTVSWLLYVVMMVPFWADLLLVRLRGMRFTFDLVAMAFEEKDNLAYVGSVDGFHLVESSVWPLRSSPVQQVPTTREGLKEEAAMSKPYGISMIIGLIGLPIIAVVVSCATTPLIAYSALNTSLNELFGHALQPSLPNMSYNLPWPEKFIHTATEEYSLFGDNTLYRRTTGFHGEKAFDVNVSSDNPPNVLLLVVESFRFHDSRYLVGEDDPSNLFKGAKLTITPNFDKWAKRGVALRNFWSSWRTSRSVESLLFAQIPLDSTTKSGMSGGRNETKLSGLPQLFTAKGYETFFTTGCKTDYDAWDLFLPSHGFDTVWGRNEMMKLAETDLGIKRDDWYGAEHRALSWGVHDDLSFQLLGDLMINKTREQRERVADKEPKKPIFLTHYTISSHVDYKQRPKWYHDAVKPIFSALFDGKKYDDNIKNYLEIRYFTDLVLGKFMDRMESKGILNDTIVVIVGDHGQGPEFGNDVPEDRDVSATRVAGSIIAEGRLGDSVGLVIDDATDNITGVPEGGFVQDGVGRSLKRKITFDVGCAGHQRLRYDRITDSVLLHDADTDHDMTTDLFPKLTAKEQAEWLRWRDDGRRANEYYAERWEKECLLAADCTDTSRP
ncbi:Alkaline-phosphatase-like, core domain [Phytophthora cactorum]|nr:Alkaline-phosphatase-like, core domain [Phytophthora cactorum]